MPKTASLTRAFLLGLVLLVAARLLIQLLLYQSGFEAITADEFGRTVAAARWMEKPQAKWGGPWLPFHAYMLGAALALKWQLLWVPRLTSIALGAASIVLVYFLASLLFKDRRIGLIAAVLLAVSPAHIWLSSVPLTAIPYFALLSLAMVAFALYSNTRSLWYAYLAAVALGIANGFRFEAWVITGLFSLFMLWESVAELWRERKPTRHALCLAMPALIPWAFPLAWILVSVVQTGDPLSSLASVRSYKAAAYGDAKDYGAYLRTTWRLDPFLTLLAPVALILCSLWRRDTHTPRWFLAVAVIPLAVFLLLHRGQLEPPSNYVRYLAPFLFVLYPMLACLLLELVQRIKSAPARTAVLASIVLAIVARQMFTTFQYPIDPSAAGLKVGERIRELRQENLELQQQPVLIEARAWQHLAIHVGANDVRQLLYHRGLDPTYGFEAERSALFSLEPEAIRSCLSSYDVSYMVVKSPELQDLIEQDLGLHAVDEVNEYRFYPVPEDIDEGEGSSSCPVKLE